MNAPPAYFDLASTVENYLTKANNLQGWSIDALEDAEVGKLQAFPFARNGAVGAHFLYRDAKTGLKLQNSCASDLKSWKDLLPMVSYSKSVEGRLHCVDVDARTNHVSYSFTHPTFFATTRCAVTDGLSSLTTVSARVYQTLFAGACADYDPTRSGLKDFTALAVWRDCKPMNYGDLMAKYSLNNGFGLHVRYPLHPYADAAIIAEQKRFIAGVQARSPCGARMMLNTNVNDGTWNMTMIRNMNDIWKISISYTAACYGNKGVCKTPRFGIKFSNDSMLD